MASGFFSMLLRMKYIGRWSLMRNTQRETLAEHTIDTAILAHALAVIGQTRFHRSVDPERTVVLAMFHDASEIITGDMPTPVKYHNARITAAYKEVEAEANRTLLDALPEDLRRLYVKLLRDKHGATRQQARQLTGEDYGLRFGEGDAQKWAAFLARSKR